MVAKTDNSGNGLRWNSPFTRSRFFDACLVVVGVLQVRILMRQTRIIDFDPTPFFLVGNQAANRIYTASIYVMGWTEYADDLGFVRRTAFCRKYDPDEGRFTAVDDPDYEHAD